LPGAENIELMEKNVLIEGPITGEMILSVMNLSGSHNDRGGQSLFVGRVRADEKGMKRVRAIEYTAYGDMAALEAKKIKEEVLSGFSDVRDIAILHSTGLVNAGEISLLILVSAGHRRQAIDACSMTVELIKERLPVWKKEIFDDLSHEWINEKKA